MLTFSHQHRFPLRALHCLKDALSFAFVDHFLAARPQIVHVAASIIVSVSVLGLLAGSAEC
jgi:hypothetical protein